MDNDTFIEFIENVLVQQKKEMIREEWLHSLTIMALNQKIIKFDDYYNKSIPNSKKETKEQILDKVNKIISSQRG